MKASASIKLHPAEQYARDAAAGRIVCSRWVKLAAKRHLDDLREGAARGLRFDVAAGQHALDFFGFLRTARANGRGRSSSCSRGSNSLSGACSDGSAPATMLALPYGLCRDRAQEREIDARCGDRSVFIFRGRRARRRSFLRATKKDQAKIVFSEAERMRKSRRRSSLASSASGINMNVPATNSKFEPLSSDEDTLDGLNISAAIVDEYHATKHAC